MAENTDKAQEALQDAEKPSIPPPAYQERASTVIETDDLQMVEAHEVMPHDEKSQMAGPSTSPTQETLDERRPVENPTRTSSVNKGKGPAYAPPLSPIASDLNETVPADEKRDVLSPLRTSPSADEGKKNLQVHFAERQEVEEEEKAPPLPRRPTNVRFSEDFSKSNTNLNIAAPRHPTPVEMSRRVPLKYTFAWNRPLMDLPTLEIRPVDNGVIPSASPALPPTAYWRMKYDRKYHARLHRCTAKPNDIDRNTSQVGDFPFRQVAELKFPEFLIPGVCCGATVKFDIHEEELARMGDYATARGKRPIPRVQKFMQCEGFLNTSYSMEIPVLDHLQASWRPVPRPRSTRTGPGQTEAVKETAIVERKTTNMEREAKKQNVTLVTIGDMIETAKRALNNETWTPYAPQHLVVEHDGRVVATYQRASPFAKYAGVLTILEPDTNEVSSVAEYIEGIVIATTTMVGMQDRIGLASGLMEAASTSGKWSQEQWLKVQREWKDRKAKRQSTSARTHDSAAPRSRGFYQGGEVGSEIFDDGLGGAISVEEREAARREQMAWDESVKAKSRRMDDGLVGAISVEEMEAAKREHLALEERKRTSVLSTSGPEPRDQANVWEEKPKFVYA